MMSDKQKVNWRMSIATFLGENPCDSNLGHTDASLFRYLFHAVEA